MSIRVLHRVACTPADFDLFFGPEDETVAERDHREAKAARICAGCPSRLPCLERALEHAVLFGVWGGTGEEERRRLRNPGALPMCRNDLHVMTPENTYTYPNGVKTCRGCRDIGNQRREPRRHDGKPCRERAA